MKRLRHIMLGLAALSAWSASAMPIGLRTALWNRSSQVVGFPVDEALPGVWSVGADGDGSAKGYDDATSACGKSVKLTAADDASAWVETVATNAFRVTFDWKSSCEPLLKGRAYDYLAFAVDGVRQGLVCGETGWTSVTNHVSGEGEHRLRWTFQRDEEGSAGEDCAWMANVVITPSVTVMFAAGGATEGAAPEPITAYADESVILPGQGSLAWPKHTFLGWTDGEGLYATGSECPIGDVAGTLAAAWKENEPETVGEYLNWPEQDFTTGGDAEWTRVQGASADGYALRSGAITHSQTSRLDTVVHGPGTVTFACKVAGEIVKRIVFDGLAFCIDGVQQGDLMGNADWASRTFEVTGDGLHTLSWLYVKDEDGSEGEDCAWVDGVEWVPDAPAGEAVDAGGGKSVTVPQSWLSENTARAATDSAANGRKVWECYVLGLDPEGVEDFRITAFPMKTDGTPDLGKMSVDPPQSRWNVSGAVPKVKGAPALAGPWAEVPEGGDPSLRFFKVEIELP